MKEERLNIEGMHCGHCAALIRKSLEMVEGVSSVEVQMGSARVFYDEEVTTREALEKAVTRFGYKVRDY